MCGIVGYFDKSASPDVPIGELIFQMLARLSCRGPDSAGVALFGKSHEPNLVLRIKLGERGDFQQRGKEIAARIRRLMPVYEEEVFSEYLRVVVRADGNPIELEDEIESLEPGLELVSLGTRLEIAKQVGPPENLEKSYHIRSFRGTCGLGHTRLSTESRVDLSHSQPFWARGLPDVATVHNGHITNYHKLRRQYEQRGFRLFTENDSEIIGLYLRDRISQGDTFEEALCASLDDFDGSFCYLAANSDSLAYVKDRFGLKPLNVAETDRFVAIATEEVALRGALDGDFEVCEPGAGQVHLWSVHSPVVEKA